MALTPFITIRAVTATMDDGRVAMLWELGPVDAPSSVGVTRLIDPDEYEDRVSWR